MQNPHETRQLIIDLRRAKESDAHRYRLVRGNRAPASLPAPLAERHHRIGLFARHSLART
jgi:hypothetical protein